MGAPTQKYSGIARLLKGEGPDHAGMGIVVGRRHVVTCAHVANTAIIGMPARNQLKPSAEIVVVFPRDAGREKRYGKVIAWSPPGKNPEYDTAVIELTEDIPDNVGVAIFADIQVPLQNNALSIFGFSHGATEGNPVEAEFKSESASAEVQIVGKGPSGKFLSPGYSGAAVWDEKHQAVVGMARAIHQQSAQPVGYMTPTRGVAAVWCDLPHETRSAPRLVSRLWSGIALLFLGLLMLCFLVNQNGYFNWSPQLAGFAGMHVYLVGGLLLTYLWYAHARNLALHHWTQRIPGLEGASFGSDIGVRRTLGVLLLIVFVFLPMYLQGHFLLKFHDQGHVYFYSRQFGFAPGELRDCLDSQNLCMHPDVGRYSTIKPRNGFPGGYWDNTYQYGGDKRPEGKESVTFWPILQPLAVIVLTLSIVAAQVRLLWILRRPSRSGLTPE